VNTFPWQTAAENDDSLPSLAFYSRSFDMKQYRFRSASAAVILSVFASLALHAPAAAAQLAHVRGTITKVSNSTLTLDTQRGTLDLALTPSTGVVEATAASRSDIKPNDFIGVTNVPGAEDARAVGVFLLPEAFRSQAGSVPWDWPGASGGSRMTNGAVQPSSRMTNGTVTTASNSGPLNLTLTYNGTSSLVTIPQGTPVVRLVPATRAALKSGEHIFAFVKPNDGRPTAANVIVGENGVVPPM
jgi:hypothetical protein